MLPVVTPAALGLGQVSLRAARLALMGSMNLVVHSYVSAGIGCRPKPAVRESTTNVQARGGSLAVSPSPLIRQHVQEALPTGISLHQASNTVINALFSRSIGTMASPIQPLRIGSAVVPRRVFPPSADNGSSANAPRLTDLDQLMVHCGIRLNPYMRNEPLRFQRRLVIPEVCVGGPLHARPYVTNLEEGTGQTEGDAPSLSSPSSSESTPPKSSNSMYGPSNAAPSRPAMAPAQSLTLVQRVSGWVGKARALALEYWAGLRLLGTDVRITSRIVNEMLQGHHLSRRERLQLMRTTADILRLVPFAVMVIVPMMDFLIPVVAKFFPRMLPSQFQDREADDLRVTKARVVVSKFLQESVEEMVKHRASAMAQALQLQAFHEFMAKARMGQATTSEEVAKFAQLFHDEFTLTQLPRPQLLAMCRFVDVPAIGTDALLRFQVTRALRQLKADDQAILKEGVASLTDEELEQACRARGLRVWAVDEDSRSLQEAELRQWIQLSLDHQIPSSLLLLSRAWMFPAAVPRTALVQRVTVQPAGLPSPDDDAGVGDPPDAIPHRLLGHQDLLQSIDRQTVAWNLPSWVRVGRVRPPTLAETAVKESLAVLPEKVVESMGEQLKTKADAAQQLQEERLELQLEDEVIAEERRSHRKEDLQMM